MSEFSISKKSTRKLDFSVSFLGTGVSTGVPSINCVLSNTKPNCEVCTHANTVSGSKNRRNNVSIAIQFADSEGAERCVVVDAGKTMRDGVLRLFPVLGIKSVDAILLTHGHADAMFGLDDVRDLQKSEQVSVCNAQTDFKPMSGFRVVSGALPIYLHQETLNVVKSAFGYLTNPPEYLDKDAEVLQRRVAYLDFRVVPVETTLNLHGLPVDVFPVYHGGTYVSLGFTLGSNKSFVYISDFKIIPEATMTYLLSIPRIHTLVLDALDLKGIYSHAGLYESIEIAKILNPEVVYFTGMSCDIGDHDEMEETLKRLIPAGNYHFAYDGLRIDGFQSYL